MQARDKPEGKEAEPPQTWAATAHELGLDADTNELGAAARAGAPEQGVPRVNTSSSESDEGSSAVSSSDEVPWEVLDRMAAKATAMGPASPSSSPLPPSTGLSAAAFSNIANLANVMDARMGAAKPAPPANPMVLPLSIAQAVKDGNLAAVEAWLDAGGHVDARLQGPASGTNRVYAGIARPDARPGPLTEPGQRARINGIDSRPELNGTSGVLRKFANGRWSIETDGNAEIIWVRTKCLAILDAKDSANTCAGCAGNSPCCHHTSIEALKGTIGWGMRRKFSRPTPATHIPPPIQPYAATDDSLDGIPYVD